MACIDHHIEGMRVYVRYGRRRTDWRLSAAFFEITPQVEQHMHLLQLWK